MAILPLLLIASFFSAPLPFANATSHACSSGVIGILLPLGKDKAVQSFCSSKFPIPPATSTIVVSTTTTLTGTVTTASTVYSTVLSTITATASAETTATVISTDLSTITNTQFSSTTTTATSTVTATVTLPPVGVNRLKRDPLAEATCEPAAAAAKANPLSTILSQASSIVSVLCTCIQTQKTATVTSSSTATQKTTTTLVTPTVVPTVSVVTVTVTQVNTITQTSIISSTITAATTIPVTATITTIVTTTTSITSTCPVASPTYCTSSQSCVNFNVDRRNCGGCGKACTADDSCVNGVCTGTNSCNPVGTACNGSNNCACFMTTGGAGVCSNNGSGCQQSCATSLDCPDGSACSGSFNCCIDASDVAKCPAPANNRFLAMKRTGFTKIGHEVFDAVTHTITMEE